MSANHEILVGQVYASTHHGDVSDGQRQRRVVTNVDDAFVWLRTVKPGGAPQPTTRVRHRCRTSIPGHRLVEDIT